MADQHVFEPQLERRLVALSAGASRPFDAGEVAHAAIHAGAAARRGGWANRRVLLLLAAGALVVLAVSSAVVVGSLLFRESVVPRPAPGILAIGTPDGFLFADADGGNVRVIDPRGPFFTPRWSPDGGMVAVTALLPEDMNSLLVFDAAGALLGGAGSVAGFEWSPDSRRLLVVDAASPGLRIIPVTGSRDDAEVPLPQGTVQIGGAAWLPDGRIVAGLTLGGESDAERGLWILDPVAGTTTRMGGDAGRNGTLPAVSPDGRRIAMGVACAPGTACRPMIRIVDAASGFRRSEINNIQWYDRVHWAPDGDGIAYSHTLPGGRITTGWWDFDDEVRGVDPWSDQNTVAAQVLPDQGGVLAFHRAGQEGPQQLWRLALDGGAPVLLRDDAYGGALQPATADGPVATATPPDGAWLPPGYGDTAPPPIAARDVVPFCGVDGGGAGDPARECLARALASRAIVEVATVRETAEGWRMATILRTTPTGGAEVTWLTDPPERPALWEHQTCGGVQIVTDGIRIEACGDLVPYAEGD
ncbi:MAG TPA: hypothetical protein VFY23_15650 [Candidatus Limnocylindrales bacterium]|nr:hypothetical protein [Candidatus Limnocylindrales bacterium]